MHNFNDLKVFLINLDSSDQRYQSAKEQLDAAHIPFERLSAFDGRQADPLSFPEYDERKARAWFGRKLSGGELGCYFSHINAAKRFLASSAPYGLSLEDDLLLKPDAGPTLLHLLEHFEAGHEPGWHMVNLGRPVKRFGSQVAEFVSGAETRVLCRAHYFPDTTTAILWSREGATRFLETAHHIYMPIDHFLRRWNCETDAGYGFIEPPITTTGTDSDIARSKVGQDTSRAQFYHFRKHRRLWADKRAAKRNLASYRH
ncbi:glycosyltransferase family 25 protein [Celeribacter neptunius]|uniref:Glycosyl transferase, family 25 n=1 Tax=Celeribacter neptunius TaxID=588602 RepID=A0A1I3TDZ4_9RHOB|nr:glycosyltransferase family 25 protein [Celeribacter neptunius]SFJ69155.1 glycosyl transferase, family 25 [Celeribacter neptunius]